MASQPVAHGVKRRGDESLESDQRLSKRFNSLNLDHDPRPWTLPSIHGAPRVDGSSGDAAMVNGFGARQSDTIGTMHVDETKDRVYIHDLDEEIASIEAEEKKDGLTFLPDIEKKLKKLTDQFVDTKPAPSQPQGGELVLYSIPSSLSVPEERDGVRKAILESRARAREKQRQAYGQDSLAFNPSNQSLQREGADWRASNEIQHDAMDIG